MATYGGLGPVALPSLAGGLDSLTQLQLMQRQKALLYAVVLGAGGAHAPPAPNSHFLQPEHPAAVDSLSWADVQATASSYQHNIASQYADMPVTTQAALLSAEGLSAAALQALVDSNPLCNALLQPQPAAALPASTWAPMKVQATSAHPAVHPARKQPHSAAWTPAKQRQAAARMPVPEGRAPWAPTWAGADWHPMAAVTAAGPQAKAGTGVFLPTCGKPAADKPTAGNATGAAPARARGGTGRGGEEWHGSESAASEDGSEPACADEDGAWPLQGSRLRSVSSNESLPDEWIY